MAAARLISHPTDNVTSLPGSAVLPKLGAFILLFPPLEKVSPFFFYERAARKKPISVALARQSLALAPTTPAKES
jgi:hypothetical protein